MNVAPRLADVRADRRQSPCQRKSYEVTTFHILKKSVVVIAKEHLGPAMRNPFADQVQDTLRIGTAIHEIAKKDDGAVR